MSRGRLLKVSLKLLNVLEQVTIKQKEDFLREENLGTKCFLCTVVDEEDEKGKLDCVDFLVLRLRLQELVWKRER